MGGWGVREFESRRPIEKPWPGWLRSYTETTNAPHVSVYFLHIFRQMQIQRTAAYPCLQHFSVSLWSYLRLRYAHTNDPQRPESPLKSMLLWGRFANQKKTNKRLCGGKNKRKSQVLTNAVIAVVVASKRLMLDPVGGNPEAYAGSSCYPHSVHLVGLQFSESELSFIAPNLNREHTVCCGKTSRNTDRITVLAGAFPRGSCTIAFLKRRRKKKRHAKKNKQ